MIRPGFLTNEYSAGRQARYIPPLRLYLISIFLFALFISMHNIFVAVDSSEAEISTVNENIIIQADDETESEFTQEDFDENVIKQIEEMQFSWLSETNNKKMRVLFKNQSEKVYQIIREDPGFLLDILLDLIPPTMFLLLPLFAILLKITYITSGRYYTEHLILALHSHSFLFLTILIINLVELLTALPALEAIVGGIVLLLEIWIPVYLFMTLKSFYGEGIAVTLFKYLFLSIAYFMLLSPLMIIALMWGFLTL